MINEVVQIANTVLLLGIAIILIFQSRIVGSIESFFKIFDIQKIKEFVALREKTIQEKSKHRIKELEVALKEEKAKSLLLEKENADISREVHQLRAQLQNNASQNPLFLHSFIIELFKFQIRIDSEVNDSLRRCLEETHTTEPSPEESLKVQEILQRVFNKLV